MNQNLENNDAKASEKKSLLSIDLSFLEIKGEFIYLRILFDILKEQIPVIIADDQAKTQEKIRALAEALASMKERDEVEYALNRSEQSIYEDLHSDFKNNKIPRFFYCPFIPILYAICEASIVEIAVYGQKRKTCKLSIKDVGGGFSKRANIYFEKVLEVKLFPNNEHSRMFNQLTVLRHAVAHANGRIDMLKEAKQVNEIIGLDVGVSTEDDCLLVTQEYVDRAISVMNEAIEDLMDRVKRM